MYYYVHLRGSFTAFALQLKQGRVLKELVWCLRGLPLAFFAVLFDLIYFLHLCVIFFQLKFKLQGGSCLVSWSV